MRHCSKVGARPLPSDFFTRLMLVRFFMNAPVSILRIRCHCSSKSLKMCVGRSGPTHTLVLLPVSLRLFVSPNRLDAHPRLGFANKRHCSNSVDQNDCPNPLDPVLLPFCSPPFLRFGADAEPVVAIKTGRPPARQFRRIRFGVAGNPCGVLCFHHLQRLPCIHRCALERYPDGRIAIGGRL